jgi:hypothetical protein
MPHPHTIVPPQTHPVTPAEPGPYEAPTTQQSLRDTVGDFLYLWKRLHGQDHDQAFLETTETLATIAELFNPDTE